MFKEDVVVGVKIYAWNVTVLPPRPALTFRCRVEFIKKYYYSASDVGCYISSMSFVFFVDSLLLLLLGPFYLLFCVGGFRGNKSRLSFSVLLSVQFLRTAGDRRAAAAKGTSKDMATAKETEAHC